MLMVDQFLRVADELGWDVRMQIEKLEAFAGLCGASARLEEYLEQRDLIGSARYDLKRVRDVMLDFVTILGNHGAMNHFLRRELTLAAEARAAAEAAARDAPAVAQAPATAPAGRGWLRRWFGRGRPAA